MAKNHLPVQKPVGKDTVPVEVGMPDTPYSQIYQTLISAIGQAESQVFLTHASFVPDPQLLRALSDAAGRGVDVRLLLPGCADSALLFHAGRARYGALLQAGVRIFERHGALLRARTAMVDGVWSTLGSANLDWRSVMNQDEINAMKHGHDFATRMATMFAIDQAASLAITPWVWRQRPLHNRLREGLARFWERCLTLISAARGRFGDRGVPPAR
jgi:cardiolipin synthase